MQRGKMRNEGEKQQGAESETPAEGHVDMARGLWGVSLETQQHFCYYSAQTPGLECRANWNCISRDTRANQTEGQTATKATEGQGCFRECTSSGLWPTSVVFPPVETAHVYH